MDNCPNCGYCKHCGRSSQPVYSYWTRTYGPIWYGAPQWSYTSPTVTTGTISAVSSDTVFVTN